MGCDLKKISSAHEQVSVFKLYSLVFEGTVPDLRSMIWRDLEILCGKTFRSLRTDLDIQTTAMPASQPSSLSKILCPVHSSHSKKRLSHIIVPLHKALLLLHSQRLFPLGPIQSMYRTVLYCPTSRQVTFPETSLPWTSLPHTSYLRTSCPFLSSPQLCSAFFLLQLSACGPRRLPICGQEHRQIRSKSRNCLVYHISRHISS